MTYNKELTWATIGVLTTYIVLAITQKLTLEDSLTAMIGYLGVIILFLIIEWAMEE